jgi:hypothetical protein
MLLQWLLQMLLQLFLLLLLQFQLKQIQAMSNHFQMGTTYGCKEDV